MKQKWLIKISRNNTLISEYKYLGSFKAAKDYAEKIISNNPGCKYAITEII